METTIVYLCYIGDNGKENGNYYSIFEHQENLASSFRTRLRFQTPHIPEGNCFEKPLNLHTYLRSLLSKRPTGFSF